MKRRKIRGYKRGRGARKRKRGKGNRGGKGNAGLGKRGQQKTIRKIGKFGFTSKIKKPSVITLRQLDNLAKKLNKKEIDLSEYGYEKIIGTGNITVPLKIKVKYVSKGAKQKIESIGGEIL